MTVVAGPLFATAGLLGAAGVLKTTRPTSTMKALRAARLPGSGPTGRRMAAPWIGRLLGLVEIAIAASALTFGGRLAAGLVVIAYIGFSLFTARLLRMAGAGASCGCFGAEESPAAPIHIVVNAGIAAAAALAVRWPTPGIGKVLGDQPLAGVPFLILTGLCGWLLFALLTVVPNLQAAMTDGQDPDALATGRADLRSAPR